MREFSWRPVPAEQLKRPSNFGFAPITAAVLLTAASWLVSGSCDAPEPDARPDLDAVVAAMTAPPTGERLTSPVCTFKPAKRLKETDWYSCDLAPEVYASLPISILDEEDFMSVAGIAWQCELRRLTGSSIVLPELHPSSPASRMGWREGDRLTGLGRLHFSGGSTVVVNLERAGQPRVMVYDIE